MIAIFRHGETIANRDNIVQGQSNTDLTELGLEQVKKNALHYLKKHHKPKLPIRCYSSGLKRSMESCEIFCHHVGINFQSIIALNECSYGIYEGLSASNPDVAKMFSEKKHDPLLYRPEGGESYHDMWNRIVGFLHCCGINKNPTDKTIIFHVHGNVSKVLRGYFSIYSVNWYGFEHPCNVYYLQKDKLMRRIRNESKS